MREKHILIIDDNELDIFIAKKILIRNYAADHLTAITNPQEALDYLKKLVDNGESFPDIIFLDLIMPGLDGCCFMKNYLEFPREKRALCSVYVLTASRKEEDLAKAKGCPEVKMYLFKPLTDKMVSQLLFREIGLQHQLN